MRRTTWMVAVAMVAAAFPASGGTASALSTAIPVDRPGIRLTPAAVGPNVVVNGGFETGSLSGWAPGGASAAVVQTPHSGSFAARLGSTSPTNGDSTMQQTVRVPTGATLSFWYQPHCPDTLTYDQEQMQVRSTSGAPLLSVLNVCSNTGVWTQVTRSLSAYGGQTVVLWFNGHDDNFSSDPTWTLFDDVSLTGTVATNDFSISANPGSVGVTQGSNGTSTISTAVTSGSSQPVSFSASGLPGGASASFNPSSVTAGGSSTLTITTSAATPAGTSTVTVTGTGASATHTTTVSLTVNGTGSAPNVVVNGGFETGSFSGWSTGGSAAAVVQTSHTGSFAAELGSASPTSGDSTMQQMVTVPAGATLSFWYQPHCPDTLTYDQEQMQVRSTAGATLLSVLNVCSNSGVWTQVTQNMSAYGGQTVVLWFNGHDDNWSTDPTWTLFDDVSLTGTVAINDFSISANPTSVSVPQGSSGTSTISTAVTGGSGQSVSLSASGLPSGASASFNPSSVTAGGSSTLTITTSAATPAGISTVTVTGTGTSATHTTTVSLTVITLPPPGLQQLSSDPFTNTTSQHATEVEPDTFSNGSTMVSTFQVGRFNNGGSSDIGWATSTDGGQTFSHGFLPGITTFQGSGPWARASDPSVAYDAKHGVWLIASLDLDSSAQGRGVTVNRSTDGLNWSNAVQAVTNLSAFLDKSWIVCDRTATSPNYGDCYIEYDDNSNGNLVLMLTSTDGGVTWTTPGQAADAARGLGGQPLVQPNGTVVVPYLADGTSQIRSFTSTDGGSTWGASVLVSSAITHTVAGGMRTSALPTAEIDAAGTVYVAWQDCRFRSGCPANDIVVSTSTNGTAWTTVQRIPIDAVTSTIDHFIPGLAVDAATSGSSAHLGLYYYYFPIAACSSCQLDVGFVSSVNGGATWSSATQVAGPMTLGQIAQTTQGPMVGDYISASFVNGRAFSVLAVGLPPSGAAFNEAMDTVPGGLVARGGVRQTDIWTGSNLISPSQPSAARLTAF